MTCDGSCQNGNPKTIKASCVLHPIAVKAEVYGTQIGIDITGPLKNAKGKQVRVLYGVSYKSLAIFMTSD